MNILMVASLFDGPQGQGGIQVLVHELATHFVASGHEVTVLAPRTNFGERETHGYRVGQLDDTPWRRMAGPLGSTYLVIRLLRAIASAKADVVVATSAWSWIAACATAARAARKPFVVLVHGNDLRVPAGAAGDRKLRALRQADAVVCNSSYVRQRVLDLGIPEDRAHLITPGINERDLSAPASCSPDELKRALNIPGRPVVLALGRLVERKGQDQLIRAWPEVLRRVPNAACVIAGGGPAESYLRALVEELGLSQDVLFVGRISPEERLVYMDMCQVMALPAREQEGGDVEGFGIVFLEANARAKPVVGGRSGGVIDAVEDGVTGLLVDPSSVHEIAGAVSTLLERPDYAAALGAQGKERVERQFTWNQLAHQHLRLLSSLAGKHAPTIAQHVTAAPQLNVSPGSGTRVSIVMPAYNSARYIREAIDSVLAQTFGGWELIVVDDGSWDDTATIVESYDDKRIRLVRMEANKGPAAARNVALRMAVGEYIAFLDADDRWAPDKLAKQVALLDAAPPEVGLVYTDCLYEGLRPGYVRTRFRGRKPPQGRAFRALLRTYLILTSTVMIRRSAVETVGLFDEALRSGQDNEFFLRIAHAYEVRAITEPLMVYRYHASNIHRQPASLESQLRAMYQVLERYGLPPSAAGSKLAELHFNQGRYLMRQGQATEAQRHLLTSVRLRPWSRAAWALLALTALDGRPYRAVKAAQAKLASRHSSIT